MVSDKYTFFLVTAVSQMLFGFAAIVVSMTQHAWCTVTPVRSGSVMVVATHLAGL